MCHWLTNQVHTLLFARLVTCYAQIVQLDPSKIGCGRHKTSMDQAEHCEQVVTSLRVLSFFNGRRLDKQKTSANLLIFFPSQPPAIVPLGFPDHQRNNLQRKQQEKPCLGPPKVRDPSQYNNNRLFCPLAILLILMLFCTEEGQQL